MILQGHRHPGESVIEKLLQYFEFDEREKRYFEELVRLGKHRGGEGRRRELRRRLRELSPAKRPAEMRFAAFTVISKWYCYAIREMVSLRGFRSDAEWIAAKLRGKVSVHQVKEALAALLQIGTLHRNEKGEMERAEDFVMTRSDVVDEGVRSFHRQMLSIAKHALDEVPVEDREFHALTFNVEYADLPALKAEVRAAMTAAAIKYDRPTGEATYQLNTQLFPLTRRSPA